MLAVFYGTDRVRARTAANEFLVEHAKGVAVSNIDDTSYTPNSVVNAAGAQSLFGGQEVYLLDTPSLNSEFETEVTGHLAELAASENIFVILEGSMLAAAKKRYARHTNTVEEFTADKTERFNTFAIADALAKKDRKNLWVLLQEAKLAGLREEEIIGMLWWQLKALRLATATDSPAQAGLKEYPYKKAKQALRSFSDGEVEKLAQSLLALYHEGHQGKADMELKLEEWALSV